METTGSSSPATATVGFVGQWRWVLLTAVAPIAWGATYYVTRQLLPIDYPLYGAAIRALPAGLLLLLITRKLPTGSWWWKSVILGVLNVGAFFILVYLAAQLLPSSLASTLMATSAAVMMLLAWPVLGQRPGLLSLTGAVLGFGGVCLMLLTGSTAVNPLGVLASLAAMLMSSVGFLLTTKWGGQVNLLSLTSWQLIAGGILVVPFAILFEGGPPALSGTQLLGFGYVSLIATGLAYVAWFSGLRHLPAGSVGVIGLLNPVTGVGLGVLLAGEEFGIRQGIGVLLVLIGVALGQLSRPQKPNAQKPKAHKPKAQRPDAQRPDASATGSGTNQQTLLTH